MNRRGRERNEPCESERKRSSLGPWFRMLTYIYVNVQGMGGVVSFVHYTNLFFFFFITLKKAEVCATPGPPTTHTIPRRSPRWEPACSAGRLRFPDRACVGHQPGWGERAAASGRPGLTSGGTAGERRGLGGGVPCHRATELLGRFWLRSGGGRRGREAGGRAIVQGGRIFVRMLPVAIARREIQTEGLSSPPSGLGAAFPPLSQNKSAARGLAPLPRRADCGLPKRGPEDPGTERGEGVSSPAGNSRAGYYWSGRNAPVSPSLPSLLSLSPSLFPPLSLSLALSPLSLPHFT